MWPFFGISFRDGSGDFVDRSAGREEQNVEKKYE
jgi:hypothetical protein